jgi:hypothetical protein
VKSNSKGLRLSVVGTIINLDLYDALCDSNLTISEFVLRFGMTEVEFSSMMFMQFIPPDINPALAEHLEKLSDKSIVEIFPPELRGRDDLYELIEQNYARPDSERGEMEIINPSRVPFEVQLAQRARLGTIIREFILKHLDVDESFIVTEMWLNECSAEDVAASFNLELEYVQRVSAAALLKLSKLPSLKRLRRISVNM